MRALTEAEGRVIAILLGGSGASERERLRRIRVPRSTYHAARRRAYQEGWLKDRYVPDPARFGFPIASFVIVRPFVDRASELVGAWGQATSNVLTWASQQVVIGVFFHPDEGKAAKGIDRLAPPEWSRWRFVLHVDVRGPTVPVYFDYEGLWTHVAEVAGTATYPNGLGGGVGTDAEAPPVTPHQRWASSELVHRPFVAQAAGKEGHLVGPLGLPFSHQRVLRSGWVAHRVFLEPATVPPFRGRSADVLTLIMGDLKPGARPELLFGTLTRECRVFPFLYVTDGRKLLIGAMGRAVGGGNPNGEAEPRRPVMATLQESLQGIEVLSEPAANFRPTVDHRYDRVFPKTTPGA